VYNKAATKAFFYFSSEWVHSSVRHAIRPINHMRSQAMIIIAFADDMDSVHEIGDGHVYIVTQAFYAVAVGEGSP
jgi:hypothetical protein